MNFIPPWDETMTNADGSDGLSDYLGEEFIVPAGLTQADWWIAPLQDDHDLRPYRCPEDNHSHIRTIANWALKCRRLYMAGDEHMTTWFEAQTQWGEQEAMPECIVIPQIAHSTEVGKTDVFYPVYGARPIQFRWRHYFHSTIKSCTEPFPKGEGFEAREPNACFLTHNGIEDGTAKGMNTYMFVFCWVKPNGTKWMLGTRNDHSGKKGSWKNNWGDGDGPQVTKRTGIKAKWQLSFTSGPRASGPGSKHNDRGSTGVDYSDRDVYNSQPEEEKAKTMERAREMCRNASTLAYEYVSLEHRPTRECPRADKPEPQLDKQPLESCLQPSKLLPVQPGEAASWLPQQPAEQRVQASHAQVGNAPPQGQGTGSTQRKSAEFWAAEEKEYEYKNRKWQGKQISNAMQGGTDQLDASDAMVAEPRDSQSWTWDRQSWYDKVGTTSGGTYNTHKASGAWNSSAWTSSGPWTSSGAWTSSGYPEYAPADVMEEAADPWLSYAIAPVSPAAQVSPAANALPPPAPKALPKALPVAKALPAAKAVPQAPQAPAAKANSAAKEDWASSKSPEESAREEYLAEIAAEEYRDHKRTQAMASGTATNSSFVHSGTSSSTGEWDGKPRRWAGNDATSDRQWHWAVVNGKWVEKQS